VRTENERPFAFAAGRSFVGQSTFALAHAPEAEFGYRETDKWKEREREGRGEENETGRKRGKEQCRELALNPIALCGITTGFY